MFKRFIFAIFVAFFAAVPAHSAQIVNVEYIHKVIEQKWGVTVPYNSNLASVQAAANMKYLLTAVDVANQILNGGALTSYGSGTYATTAAADTVAANTAAETLIQKYPSWSFTTTDDTASFSFYMSAKGNFLIDWGDGKTTLAKRTSTSNNLYRHTYSTADAYTVTITGRATGYSTGSTTAAISFYQNTKLASITGGLGRVFPTIGDGSAAGQQPRFYQTFLQCSNLTGEIPADLFTGVKGQPVSNMFSMTFYLCKKLTGSIPATLFDGIKGEPVERMFSYTFNDSGVNGTIPENLFVGIKGAPAPYMFNGTFGTTKVSGTIPEKLFAGIEGAPAERMFGQTFAACPGLTGPIPEKLFAGIKGAPAVEMFVQTFSGTKVTGPLPAGLFAGIEGAPAKSMYSLTFQFCSGLTGSIPAGLFGKIKGAPAEEMYWGTFVACSNLSGPIPENLLGDLSGPAAAGMFGSTYGDQVPANRVGTFARCPKLTGPSAKINGKYLYEIWPDATREQVGDTYVGDTKLDDWDNIPDTWK